MSAKQAEADAIGIDYHFIFDDGREVQVDVRLHPTRLGLLIARPRRPPKWTKLANNRCSVCHLDEKEEYCPLALNMTHIIDLFPDRYSYEDVNLKVVKPERTTTGRTTLQHALSSLAGIFMVTSGCEPLDKLRPMVRFHQPLATLQETIYRAMSMYLMAQFMRARKDLMPDWTLAGLEALYHEVHMVNVDFGKRLQQAPGYDANTNALMRLDMFTYGFTQSFEEALEELDPFFQGYFTDSR